MHFMQKVESERLFLSGICRTLCYGPVTGQCHAELVALVHSECHKSELDT